MKRMQWYGPTLLLLVTMVVVVIAGPQVARNIQWQHTDANISLIRKNLSNSDFLSQLSQSFRKVAIAVEPSVVHIQVLARPIVGMLPQQDNLRRYDAFVQVGSGSGWVYDTNGHIITNAHVVQSAERIRVRFSSGSEYDAEVLNTDRATDVAVLKVDAADLHPAVIARESVEQGDIVFAFGSPFHFDFSMSQGIVSGQGRTLGWLAMQGGYEDFIQTDAAINPGNSGGPLTNIRGEVVGMNSAIASRDGNFDGVGFAIPVDMVRHVVDQLINQGQVRRGFLGIRLPDVDLDERTARAFGFDGQGVVVQDLTMNGPAAAAGIRAGDIVVKVNGEPTETVAELRYLISSYPPNEKVTIQVFRGGRYMDIEVMLGELPQVSQAPRRNNETETPLELDDLGALSDDAGQADASDAQQSNSGSTPSIRPFDLTALRQLGVGVMTDVTPEMAQRLQQANLKGVWIERVRRMSVAAAAGLRPGMIITHVGDIAVSDLEELTQAIGQYTSGQAMRLRVMQYQPNERRMINRFVVLEVP